jgi:hypothetical protein
MLRYCVARIDNSTRLVLELQNHVGNVRAGKVEPEEPAKGRTHFLRALHYDSESGGAQSKTFPIMTT